MGMDIAITDIHILTTNNYMKPDYYRSGFSLLSRYFIILNIVNINNCDPENCHRH